MAVRPVAAPASLALAMGGFGLRFKSDSPGIINVLKRRYGRFSPGIKKEAATFLIRESGGKVSPFRPAVSMSGSRLELARGDFKASLDLRGGSGELSAAANEQCLDAFLRSLLSTLLLRRGGLMLHSAGLVKGGRAYLFLGRSGAGKSTLSRLAAGAGVEVISDEINMVRRERGNCRAYGSPFWGEMRADGRPGAWPLAGIYLLKKAARNRLRPCGPGEVLGPLLRCLLNFEKGPRVSGAVLDAAAALLGRTPAGLLEFSKEDASFLDLI